jgi:5'-deoxynucleotidase
MDYHFFATVSRMKYIERWALMRNSRPENLSEHSLEVGMIAHALCVIGNVRYGKSLNAEKAALIGMYHDASEIITGDMPTPVKYYNDDIRTAFKEVEALADARLLSQLPEDLRPAYQAIFQADPQEAYLRRLVKAADKLSALIKCMEEENTGNQEFRTAKQTIREALTAMEQELPEVSDFIREFIPSYGKTLDELS